MSRPPVRRNVASPRGINTEAGRERYFAPRFADLVALAETLARDRHGVEIPGKDRGLARSLIEIPALFAHILGEHQSHYADEAWLGSAQEAASLTAHARRLAYEPDRGVAATGLAVFEVKAGLSGNIAAGFALSSEPFGEARAQTYETLEPAHVEEGWNRILPADARRETEIAFSDDSVVLPLSASHRLERGETVLLEGQGKAAVCLVADPLDGLSVMLTRLSQGDESTGIWPASDPAAPYRIHASPRLQARAFGWNADPLVFDPDDLAEPDLHPGPGTAPTASGNTARGYVVDGALASAFDGGELIALDIVVTPPQPGSMLALMRSAGPLPRVLARAEDSALAFVVGTRVAIPVPEDAPSGTPTSQLIEQRISGRATLLGLATLDGDTVAWSELPLDVLVLGDWADVHEVAPTEPDPAPLPGIVALKADLSAMRPGQRIIAESLSDGFAAAATVTRLLPPAGGEPDWRAVLSFDGGLSPGTFALGDVAFRGNTAAVSHGATEAAEIGSSDGVTPHQAFELKKAPVTRLPGVEGAEPALELRVDGVLWDLADDFHGADADARIFRTETDAGGKVSVVFGGEGRGAVPPAGRRNIAADYRVGLGRIGNAGSGRLTRIKKSSPLLDSVINPLAISGGTDPAAPEDLRRQATRKILTFDRAVSVQDHADLALLFPGVARAAARWMDRGAVEVIAADADGAPPADPAALRAFLEARRDNALPLALLDPQPVDVEITLRVERDRAWLADAVRLAVTEALIGTDDRPGLFTFAGRGFSQPQSLSGLYARVLSAEGVTGVEATRYALADGAGVAEILHATDRQWLRLQPTALTVEVVDPGTLVAATEGTP